MNISVLHQKGGMMETQQTGIYPDYLIFSAPGLFGRRRVRVNGKAGLGDQLRPWRIDQRFIKL
jgi:hypothetical protein